MAHEIYKVLRTVNSRLATSQHKEASRIVKDNIVLLLTRDELHVERFNKVFYTYYFLLNDEVHAINGQLDNEVNKIIIEDSWHGKFLIKDFELDKELYFENTFEKAVK